MSLKKGDSGDAVRIVQERLITRGYLPVGEADGNFGKRTDAAIRAFQFSQGLKVDGVVGPLTLEALDKAGTTTVTEAPPLPADAPVSVPAPMPVARAFDEHGWYKNARRCPLHAGRTGAEIEAKGVTVHTSDTMPGGMPNVLRRWHLERDKGQGAHFWLGRRAPTAAELLDEEYPSAGLAQMCPINRNGNHAGGPNGAHGWVLTPDGKKLHPNSHYVGIEVDAGGKLEKIGGLYRHKVTQRVVAPEDVYTDERGQHWHRITEYQFEVLGQLLDDLDREMPGRFPAGCTIKPNGSHKLNYTTWAEMPGVRFVGHVTLDPIRKRDPGPQLIAWLKERYGDRG